MFPVKLKYFDEEGNLLEEFLMVWYWEDDIRDYRRRWYSCSLFRGGVSVLDDDLTGQQVESIIRLNQLRVVGWDDAAKDI
jgi:hypothetical protein